MTQGPYPYVKPNVVNTFKSHQSVQDVIDWLDKLRSNALRMTLADGTPVGNQALADECEHAIAVIENLVRNLYHSR